MSERQEKGPMKAGREESKTAGGEKEEEQNSKTSGGEKEKQQNSEPSGREEDGRTSGLYPLQKWNQHEAALHMWPRTNNSSEGN